MKDDNITDIATYLRSHSEEIGARILSSYAALHGADEAPSPLLSRMVRVPYRLSCRDGWRAAERARFREKAPA